MNPSSEAPAHGISEEAIWQDVEFGSYTADLPVWEELADGVAGPVLELGAGAGRVSLHLASRGAEVIALERDPELIAELKRRATGHGGKLTTLRGDLATPGRIHPRKEPGLVIAPLHVVQVLDCQTRLALLGALRDLVPPRTILAAALVDESTLLSAGTGAARILPDMREVEGWVYSSEPLWVQVGESQLKVRRIRERVSPDGAMDRTVHDELLQRISPERFQLEADEVGFGPAGTRPVSSGPDEADSVVAFLEAR